MEADKRIDVQPNGKIQERFVHISVDDLKNAKDQTNNTPIFNGLSDEQLKALKSSLNEVASAFKSPTPPSELMSASLGNSTAGATGSSSYLHPKTSKAVAVTRHVSQRHLGLISHPTPGKSFRICLHPNLSFETLPAGHSATSFGMLYVVSHFEYFRILKLCQ
jgi:hypothetical protein